MIARFFITFLILFQSYSVQAQDQHLIDSCKTVIEEAKHLPDGQAGDTSICNAYMVWGEQIFLRNPDTAAILFQKVRETAERNLASDLLAATAAPLSSLKKKYLLSLADALNNIGYIYNSQGNIQKALDYLHKSLRIEEELGNKKGVAVALNNLGYMYMNQGDIQKALELHHKSLKISEEIGSKRGIASSLDNIGYIYNKQGDPSCTASKEECRKRGIESALNYYQKSLKIYEEIIGDTSDQTLAVSAKQGLAGSLNNIGVIYLNHGDPSCTASKEECLRAGVERALSYYHKSLKIWEEIGDREGVAYSLKNIGDIYLDNGDVSGAKEYAKQSMQLAKDLGFPEIIRNAAQLLTKIHKKQGKDKEALASYELFIQMRDSIKNEETQKASIRQQTKYEFEKAQLVKEQEEKEVARVEAEVRSRRDNLQYSIVLICLLVIGGLVAMLGKLSLPIKVAEGIIFFSFLILFEFLLVLADPYIEGWSGGAPGFKLLFNAGIAALIFPLHSLFEIKLKKRLAR
ncbi:MAG: tetratricopeptide repeat protein [Flavobacteriales bacterium]|nr:tetratricopeptide repeat protein [Flavobacteriales bacterium]